jgi:hypothetical protein
VGDPSHHRAQGLFGSLLGVGQKFFRREGPQQVLDPLSGLWLSDPGIHHLIVHLHKTLGEQGMEGLAIVGECDLPEERACRGREAIEELLSEPQEFLKGPLLRILSGRYIVGQAPSQGGYRFDILWQLIGERLLAGWPVGRWLAGCGWSVRLLHRNSLLLPAKGLVSLSLKGSVMLEGGGTPG